MNILGKFANRAPGTPDAPLSAAELARWNAAIETAEEADKRAGITDPGTVSARKAFNARAFGGRS